MHVDECPRIAKIHVKALHGDFLPSLGEDFLRSCFYPSMAKNPYADVLVAVVDGDVCGFVLAVVEPDRYLRWFLLRNALPILTTLLVRSVANPRCLLEAGAVALRGAPNLGNAGEIAFIAVRSDKQRQGIGPRLVEAANELFRKCEKQVGFTKTLANNHHVIAMYRNRFAGEVYGRLLRCGKVYAVLVWNT